MTPRDQPVSTDAPNPLTRPLLLLLTAFIAGMILSYAFTAWSFAGRLTSAQMAAAHAKNRVAFLEDLMRNGVSPQGFRVAPAPASPATAFPAASNAAPLPSPSAKPAALPAAQAVPSRPALQPARATPPQPATTAAPPSAGAGGSLSPAAPRERSGALPPVPPGVAASGRQHAMAISSNLTRATAASPTPSPTASAPASLPASLPVEFVSASAAGVLEVHAQHLIIKGGKKLALGDRFETGETLVDIQLSERRITTSRRILVLL